MADEETVIGRPTVFTPETIAKLEQAFLHDFNDLEACLYAGIGKTALYDYQKANPAFAERKAILRQSLSMKAKTVLSEKIQGNDIPTIKWWLERRRKDEFAERQEQTGAGGAPLENKTLVIEKVRVMKPGEGAPPRENEEVSQPDVSRLDNPQETT